MVGQARTEAQLRGDAAEDLVARHLEASGWTVLERNVHVGRAELDLIAIDPGPPGTLVVVEVRWRSRRDFGTAEETVDRRKRSRLRQAAWRWVEEGDRPRLSLRFDVVAVEPSTTPGGSPRIRHHRAAF